MAGTVDVGCGRCAVGVRIDVLVNANLVEAEVVVLHGAGLVLCADLRLVVEVAAEALHKTRIHRRVQHHASASILALCSHFIQPLAHLRHGLDRQCGGRRQCTRGVQGVEGREVRQGQALTVNFVDQRGDHRHNLVLELRQGQGALERGPATVNTALREGQRDRGFGGRLRDCHAAGAVGVARRFLDVDGCARCVAARHVARKLVLPVTIDHSAHDAHVLNDGKRFLAHNGAGCVYVAHFSAFQYLAPCLRRLAM